MSLGFEHIWIFLLLCLVNLFLLKCVCFVTAEKNPCASNPCRHLGTCTNKDDGDSFACRCRHGWGGSTCDECTTFHCAVLVCRPPPILFQNMGDEHTRNLLWITQWIFADFYSQYQRPLLLFWPSLFTHAGSSCVVWPNKNAEGATGGGILWLFEDQVLVWKQKWEKKLTRCCLQTCNSYAQEGDRWQGMMSLFRKWYTWNYIVHWPIFCFQLDIFDVDPSLLLWSAEWIQLWRSQLKAPALTFSENTCHKPSSEILSFWKRVTPYFLFTALDRCHYGACLNGGTCTKTWRRIGNSSMQRKVVICHCVPGCAGQRCERCEQRWCHWDLSHMCWKHQRYHTCGKHSLKKNRKHQFTRVENTSLTEFAMGSFGIKNRVHCWDCSEAHMTCIMVLLCPVECEQQMVLWPAITLWCSCTHTHTHTHTHL